jgi:lipid-A-disaccharide synthase-like uncharacterized protein
MTPQFTLLDLLGFAGALVFCSRFYVQWYYSERAGRSVVPVGFWYLSAIGSVTLFVYGVLLQSPLGVLAHCFNMVVYARNLIHIWRRHGKLSRWRLAAANGAMALSIGAAICLLAYTWLGEYQTSKEAHPQVAFWTWGFIFLGVLGQMLFACRFVVQLAVTEAKQKSVIPPAFWYISIAATVLQLISFGARGEWVFILGLLSSLPVYLRNLWLIRKPIEPEIAA